jgi:hypothetical protein
MLSCADRRVVGIAIVIGAIEVIEALSKEDQEALVDLIRRRLIERRREEMARHAAETFQAVRDRRAKYGSVEDLKRDLLAEP